MSAPIAITPQWVDAILVLVAVEFVALRGFLRRASRGVLVAPAACFLASGACLLAALRAALAGAAPHWIAVALLASGIAHGATLYQLHRRLRLAPEVAGAPREETR